jgi:hypothetical protein
MLTIVLYIVVFVIAICLIVFAKPNQNFPPVQTSLPLVPVNGITVQGISSSASEEPRRDANRHGGAMSNNITFDRLENITVNGNPYALGQTISFKPNDVLPFKFDIINSELGKESLSQDIDVNFQRAGFELVKPLLILQNGAQVNGHIKAGGVHFMNFKKNDKYTFTVGLKPNGGQAQKSNIDFVNIDYFRSEDK